MARKNACYQCEKRSAECHATCEPYLEYEKQKMETITLTDPTGRVLDKCKNP